MIQQLEEQAKQNKQKYEANLSKNDLLNNEKIENIKKDHDLKL